MTRPTALLTRRFLLAIPASLALALFGCAGGGAGSELSVKPKPQRITEPQSVTLRIPQDKPFNILLPSSSRQPGLDGTATADAQAKADGTAEATAAVTAAGNAEGLFQIGHAFSNDTDRQTDFAFTVKCHYDFEAQATPELSLPDTTVGLRLYARDNVGRLVRDFALVAHSTENGAAKRHGDENLDFTLTLGPGDSINVFLAGQVKVAISEGRSGSGALRLSGLSISLTTQPAPPVRTTGNEQR